jgi:hypothetical protein
MLLEILAFGVEELEVRLCVDRARWGVSGYYMIKKQRLRESLPPLG